ncbi:zinc finger BED domain-containing protein RICESLEEPER 2-like [Capsicum chacoense]
MAENTTTDEAVPVILGDESTNSICSDDEIKGGFAGDVAIISWKFEQEQCRRALCRMVIVDELPFRFVEKEGFRNFMKVVQPHFKIPSHYTVTHDCFKLFDEEKQKLKSHRGEDMANEISKCLRDRGIDKIFTITVDNASSNDVTVKELAKIFTKRGTNFMNGEHLHVRCMTHIINLIVQDGLKVTGVSIEKVRKTVKYIRQFPARCKRFQEYCEDVDINSKKSLCLDVSSRWNSTYLMLNRAVECENGLMSYVYRDIGLSHHLQFIEDEEGTIVGAFSSDDWDHVKKITNFFQIFYDLTKKVSGSLYVTSNLHFLKICEVSYYLKQLILSDDDGDDLLGKIASNMKKKFDKYWGSPKKMNKMIFIFMCSESSAQVCFESGVKDYMNLMYGECVKAFSKDKDSQHPSSSSSSLFENSSSLPSSSGSTVQSIGSLGSFMDDIMKHKSGNTTTVKIELQKYLDEANEGEPRTLTSCLGEKYIHPDFLFLLRWLGICYIFPFQAWHLSVHLVPMDVSWIHLGLH